jgi:hypothetical protein
MAGAVYKPVALIVPAPVAGATDHVTEALLVPVTAAVNCCVPPPFKLTVAGVTDTDTGVPVVFVNTNSGGNEPSREE